MEEGNEWIESHSVAHSGIEMKQIKPKAQQKHVKQAKKPFTRKFLTRPKSSENYGRFPILFRKFRVSDAYV